MLPDTDDRVLPGIEDDNADHDKGASGQDLAADDEVIGDEIDGDQGGGAEDDLDDDDAGAGEGQKGQQDQVARKGNPEFGRLRAERRAAQEEAATLRARLEALEQGRSRQSTAEQEAAERARLELMSPEEKTDYLVNKTRTETRNEVQQLRFEMADSRDAARFDALCARHPVFADLAEEVEKQLTQLRRNGGDSTREVVAKFILGDRAFRRSGQQKDKQAKRGKENIRKQTTKPANSGSDRGADDARRGGNDKDARAKRLKDVRL